MLWRSYNEIMEPENDEIIKKSVGFVIKLIEAVYQKMGERRVQEIKVFIDKERQQIIDELKFVFIFYCDKKNIGVIEIDDYKFIDDRILSAVKVYGVHLRKEKSNLMIKELEDEIRNIDKLLKKHSVENGNYDLYTKLYKELNNGFNAIV